MEKNLDYENPWLYNGLPFTSDDIIDLDHQDKIKSILTGDGQHKDFYFSLYMRV